MAEPKIRARAAHRLRTPWERLLVRIAGVVGIIVAFLGILIAINYPALSGAYREGLAAKTSFMQAQTALLAQEFSGAAEDITRAKGAFANAETHLERLFLLDDLPILRTQLRAVRHLVSIGRKTSDGLLAVLRVVTDILEPIQSDQQLSIASLSKEEKRLILKGLSGAGPAIGEAKTILDEAASELSLIPKRGLLGPVARAVSPVRDLLPKVHGALEQAVPLAEILPTIAGYPTPQTYLFLLENNTELRPAGGFIGTYGILRVEDGEIASFTTDNVYNLDSRVVNTLFLDPPAPLKKYNFATQWFFRDSNWSPDFPTAANEALNFYRRESGSTETIHGIIAITPTLIEDLLRLTGDITVEGITFTADTFTSELQEQVSRGFLQQGIPQSERKEIIGGLGTILLNRLLALPQSRWPELGGVLEENLQEKHLLFWTNRDTIQEKILIQNWAGALQPYVGDYVMIVDANIGSLKSDPAVRRSIVHEVTKDGDRSVATTTIEYRNEGTITWKTTRYRTYVRLYAPLGSVLLDAEGADLRDRDTRAGEVETMEELGKTVFGAFKSIEPGDTERLTFRYVLPELVARQVEANAYTLLVQKQAGTANYDLQVRVAVGKPVSTFSPLDKGRQENHTEVLFSTILERDREFTVSYR